MKRGRERIALEKGLLNTAPGLVQSCVVGRHSDIATLAEREGLLQDRGKQLLRFPATAGMKKVLRSPASVLTPIGPDDPGQGPSPQADQRSQRLANGTPRGPLLRE